MADITTIEYKRPALYSLYVYIIRDSYVCCSVDMDQTRFIIHSIGLRLLYLRKPMEKKLFKNFY